MSPDRQTSIGKMLGELDTALDRQAQRNRIALGLVFMGLPEHDFPPELIDPINVRPIRPPGPPELAA